MKCKMIYAINYWTGRIVGKSQAISSCFIYFSQLLIEFSLLSISSEKRRKKGTGRFVVTAEWEVLPVYLRIESRRWGLVSQRRKLCCGLLQTSFFSLLPIILFSSSLNLDNPSASLLYLFSLHNYRYYIQIVFFITPHGTAIL